MLFSMQLKAGVMLTLYRDGEFTDEPNNLIGHLRPLCTLAARLLQERQMYITFITGLSAIQRVEDELSRNLELGNGHVRDLVRYPRF